MPLKYKIFGLCLAGSIFNCSVSSSKKSTFRCLVIFKRKINGINAINTLRMFFDQINEEIAAFVHCTSIDTLGLSR